jgi:uncharacterized protein affecting Mg2+/Co2+ transport
METINQTLVAKHKAVSIGSNASAQTQKWVYRGWLIEARAHGDVRNKRIRRNWTVSFNGFRRETWGNGLAGAKTTVDSIIFSQASLGGEL